MKHKGIDYKTSAVQYYLNNNESIDKVCKNDTHVNSRKYNVYPNVNPLPTNPSI